MKAKLVRTLIKEVMVNPKTFGYVAGIVANLDGDINNELLELEQLADIGRATKKMFKSFERIGGKIFSPAEKSAKFINVINFDTVNELLEWAEEEDK